MTSLFTRIPRTTFEHIVSFLSFTAKELLHQLCPALRPLLSSSCYHHDAIDLDLSGCAQRDLGASHRLRREARLMTLLPHVASIRISGNAVDLPAGLKAGLIAAVKGRWLHRLSLEEPSRDSF